MSVRWVSNKCQGEVRLVMSVIGGGGVLIGSIFWKGLLIASVRGLVMNVRGRNNIVSQQG